MWVVLHLHPQTNMINFAEQVCQVLNLLVILPTMQIHIPKTTLTPWGPIIHNRHFLISSQAVLSLMLQHKQSKRTSMIRPKYCFRSRAHISKGNTFTFALFHSVGKSLNPTNKYEDKADLDGCSFGCGSFASGTLGRAMGRRFSLSHYP